jgi:cysteine desulfurase
MFSFLTKKEKRIYLDNAGATEILPKAKEELIRMLELFGNPSAIHKEGARASQELDKARAVCARLLNAHGYEITFVSGGTESCNLAIMGTYFAWRKNNEGTPHIITSSIEHPAVLEAVTFLQKHYKVEVTYIQVEKEGIVKVQDVRNAIKENTILISVMYANNEVGTIQPVKEIGREISLWKKEHGRDHNAYPYFHTDACQAGNYLSLDVLRLKCHLMSVNSSKVYGPKGIGLLYRREGIHLDPLFQGGGQERGIRSGTESVALATSFAVALEEVQKDKVEEGERLAVIRDSFIKDLQEALPEVTLYGAFDEIRKAKEGSYREMRRLPNNINIRVPGISSEEMILRLDAKGFAVSHKSACASKEDDGSYVIMALGATDAEAKENIRITLGRQTRESDMKALLKTIKEIITKYRS